jgi:ribosomal-protein-alanine N-acetyltransferase
LESKVFPIIETKRLLLREIIISDAPAIYQYLSDKDVIKYLEGSTDTISEAEGYINWISKTYQEGSDIRWGIVEKESNKLIGDCGFGHINEPLRPTEIGYMIAKDYWNRGYMTEVLNSMLNYGFHKLKLHRIQGWVHPLNIASWKVMTKHGFIKEGTLREYIYVWHKEEYIDVDMYSLLKKDYTEGSRYA